MFHIWEEGFSTPRIILVTRAGRLQNNWINHHSMEFPTKNLQPFFGLRKGKYTDD